MEPGKTYWNILMWVMLFSGRSLITIKWNWGKFFPKIGKWITPKIKEKKVIYTNSKIPVKICKKGFVFLVALILKNTTNHSLKITKVFSQ